MVDEGGTEVTLQSQQLKIDSSRLRVVAVGNGDLTGRCWRGRREDVKMGVLGGSARGRGQWKDFSVCTPYMGTPAYPCRKLDAEQRNAGNAGNALRRKKQNKCTYGQQ